MVPGTISPEMDAATHDAVAATLGRAGQRYTAARRRLLDAVGSAGRPVTLPDVLELDRGLSQSSAYRNLDVLERAGVIRRLATGGERAYFELAEPLLDHHHHLICVDCGVVEDVELGPSVERAVDEALGAAAERAGFTPLHHSLDLHGRCSTCG